MTAGEVRIEYMPLSQIASAPRNPRRHALEMLGESVGRFGLVAVPILNETTGRLVAGHGRIKALTKARAGGEEPPRYVRVAEDGEWLVPVQRGNAFADDREAEAYLLADNRQADLASWDEDLLQLLRIHASDDGLVGIGWSVEDLDRLESGVHGRGDESRTYDESAADDVEMITCPKCAHQFPR